MEDIQEHPKPSCELLQTFVQAAAHGLAQGQPQADCISGLDKKAFNNAKALCRAALLAHPRQG